MTGNPVDNAVIIPVAGFSGEVTTTLEENSVFGRPAAVFVGISVLLVKLVAAGKPDAVIEVELLTGWPTVDKYVVVTVTTDGWLVLELLLGEDADDK